MAHYFDASNTKSEEFKIQINYNGEKYPFISDNSVFSKNELDTGTKLLIDGFLESIEQNIECKCLDIGCGWGAVGIISEKENKNLTFDFVDINARAIELTKKNIELNGLKSKNSLILESDCCEKIKENKYDYVVTNPPFRAGNLVLFKIFEQAKNVLNDNGKFVVVLRRKQGAKTYVKKILEHFKEFQLLEKDKGYEVYLFTK